MTIRDSPPPPSRTTPWKIGALQIRHSSFSVNMIVFNYCLDCLVYLSLRGHRNLVPRVSSLLYLYSGIQETVRKSDQLFAILGRNSYLRGVNDLGMSKFDVKPHSLPIPAIICNLFPKFERIMSHFIFEAAVKVSGICNLGPFSLQTKRAYFHIEHTY